MTDGRSAPGPRAERFALPLLMLLALAVRVREALRAPLWYDELYSVSASARPLREVLAVMRADVHPPLHFMLEWAWLHVAHSDLAIRGLSIAFGMGALFSCYLLARELFGKRTAQLSTLLVALHPWHVYVSQEARSYSLLWFALVGAWLGAWRWSEHGRRRDAALFVIAAAVAAWTHYLAIMLLAMQAAWGLARFAREPRRLGQWLLLHVAAGVLFAPIMPLAWAQFHRIEGEHWLQPPHLPELFDTARRLAFGGRRLMWPLFALSLWPLAVPQARRPAGFALAIGPLALLACWALGTRGIRLFAFKYMLFAIVPIVTLVAAGAARLPGRAARWVAAALLVAVATRALVRQPAYPEAESFAAVRAHLADRTRAGDVVFHADAHTYLFGRRYYPRLRHRLLAMGQVLPYYDGRAVVPDSAFGDALELREASAAGKRWWAIAWGRGALRAAPLAALADSFVLSPPESCGLVRLWSGGAISPRPRPG